MKDKNSLKRLRKARDVTLKELSAQSGVALSTINNFENGRSGMSDEKLEKIARILSVTPAEIIAAPGSLSVREEDSADAYAPVIKVVDFLKDATPEQKKMLDLFLDALQMPRRDPPESRADESAGPE